MKISENRMDSLGFMAFWADSGYQCALVRVVDCGVCVTVGQSWRWKTWRRGSCWLKTHSGPRTGRQRSADSVASSSLSHVDGLVNSNYWCGSVSKKTYEAQL